MCSLQCNYPFSKEKNEIISLLFLSYASVYSRQNPPCAKHLFSPTLRLYWCIGCLLAASKEGDETWAPLLDMGSMISAHSYSPDLQNKAAQRIFCEGSHPQCRGLHFCSFRKDLLAASWACPSS